MHYNIYLSALLMAATCCSLVICYLTWKRRELPIAVSYGLGMLTSSFYTFGYAFEILSPTMESIRFWLRIEYIGIPFGTAFWFMLVLQYTGRQLLVHKRTVALLLVVPLTTFVTQQTNEWHHLFYTGMTLNWSEGFPLVVLNKGPFYLLHVYVSYLLFVIGMVLLIQKFFRSSSRMRKQVAFMIIGSWGPYGFTLIYLSGVVYVPIDLSPFGFIISGLFFLWGIYQFNMLRLAPLALQKVFESMKDAVIVFDMENTMTSFNQSAAGIITGLHKRLIGEPAVHVLARYPALLERMTQDTQFESKVRLKVHSEDRVYEVQRTFISNNKRKPSGKMLLLSDVTSAIRAEEILLENARQLSELNQFKDKMFSVVAHDIRDPLAVLVNLMELLEEDLQHSEDKHEEIVSEMGEQIRNTFKLVETLLEWFKSQRGGMRFNPIVRDLHQVVRQGIGLMKVRSDSKSIGIYSAIAPSTFVLADQEMLDLVIRNLLSNAIKFTDEGGSITLEAERHADKLVVSVSDTGKGVAPEQADLILQEAYPQSMMGTAGEKGAGIGLLLCREFIRLNGGEFWFDSDSSSGSTFYFSIPASDPSTVDRTVHQDPLDGGMK